MKPTPGESKGGKPLGILGYCGGTDIKPLICSEVNVFYLLLQIYEFFASFLNVKKFFYSVLTQVNSIKGKKNLNYLPIILNNKRKTVLKELKEHNG